MKNLIEELINEIREEAENNVDEAVKTKRTIILYGSLWALLVLIAILIINWRQDAFPLCRGTVIIIFIVLFAMTILTDLPLRLANLIRVRRTEKFSLAAKKEFDNLLEKKLQTCAEDIESQNDFIGETQEDLKQYQLECEENLREAENLIDELEAQRTLLQQIKNNRN